MIPPQNNPYLPPATTSQLQRTSVRLRSRVSIAAVLIGMIAYHAVVGMLLLSPPDFTISLLFLANTPIFALWLIELIRNRSSGWIFGLLGAVANGFIAWIMCVVLPGVDYVAVAAINGGMALGFLTLSYICWRNCRVVIGPVVTAPFVNTPFVNTSE